MLGAPMIEWREDDHVLTMPTPPSDADDEEPEGRLNEDGNDDDENGGEPEGRLNASSLMAAADVELGRDQHGAEHGLEDGRGNCGDEGTSSPDERMGAALDVNLGVNLSLNLGCGGVIRSSNSNHAGAEHDAGKHVPRAWWR